MKNEALIYVKVKRLGREIMGILLRQHCGTYEL